MSIYIVLVVVVGVGGGVHEDVLELPYLRAQTGNRDTPQTFTVFH